MPAGVKEVNQRILVGTAGWADSELIAAKWYPPSARTPAGRLAYYAERFPLVEVNSAYYAIPARGVVESWVSATPALTMDVKAFRLLTGHRTPMESLPRDLRAQFANERGAADGVPGDLVDEVWRRFHEAIEPLVDAGRLGVVLLQFPPTVIANPAGREHVARALERCAPLRVAVEWRHGSWLDPSRREDSLSLLSDHGAAYVCVDMPRHSATAMPPSIHVTADTAVIRLHGRSRDWRDGGKRERYRYEYSDDELRGWADNARLLAKECSSVHVIVNTCCGATAQHTAERLKALLE